MGQGLTAGRFGRGASSPPEQHTGTAFQLAATNRPPLLGWQQQAPDIGGAVGHLLPAVRALRHVHPQLLLLLLRLLPWGVPCTAPASGLPIGWRCRAIGGSRVTAARQANIGRQERPGGWHAVPAGGEVAVGSAVPQLGPLVALQNVWAGKPMLLPSCWMLSCYRPGSLGSPQLEPSSTALLHSIPQVKAPRPTCSSSANRLNCATVTGWQATSRPGTASGPALPSSQHQLKPRSAAGSMPRYTCGMGGIVT